MPSLANPHFMETHALATRVGLLPGAGRQTTVRVTTIDTDSIGPVSGLLEVRATALSPKVAKK